MRKWTTILVLALIQLVSSAGLGMASAHAAEETVFFVIRHADKLSEMGDSPLSDAGKKRAQQLCKTLMNLRIDAIYHTDTLRSKQTAAPLARKLNITPAEYPATPPEGLPQWAAGVLNSQKGKRVLIVGHSGTVEAIVLALSGKQVDTISGYDNLFIVVVSDQQKSMVRLKYGAAN